MLPAPRSNTRQRRPDDSHVHDGARRRRRRCHVNSTRYSRRTTRLRGNDDDHGSGRPVDHGDQPGLPARRPVHRRHVRQPTAVQRPDGDGDVHRPHGDVVGTDTATYQAGTTVRFVYPGASVDAAGNPPDWPGWVFDGDEWVVDPTDAFLRDGLTVVVEVNPTASDTVCYPPATPSCTADPPTTPPSARFQRRGRLKAASLSASAQPRLSTTSAK